MTLEFWFEFASTYSYLTVMRIEQVAQNAGVQIVWKPFLLGPIFATQGWSDSPFNIYPAKGRYMWRDMERRAIAYGIPFRRPSEFPRRGLLAARVALIAAREGWCPAFAKAVFLANFAEDQDIGDSSCIERLINALGKNGQEVRKQAETPENKAALRQQTEIAQQSGIFGAPSFLVGAELFWGDDRLEEAIAWARKRES
ncbi:MAG: 2-hydroxychromene-2-carboxylate isomerase [Candidatus Binatia bacterium]